MLQTLVFRVQLHTGVYVVRLNNSVTNRIKRLRYVWYSKPVSLHYLSLPSRWKVSYYHVTCTKMVHDVWNIISTDVNIHLRKLGMA